jgi:hypothetical protein
MASPGRLESVSYLSAHVVLFSSLDLHLVLAVAFKLCIYIGAICSKITPARGCDLLVCIPYRPVRG